MREEGGEMSEFVDADGVIAMCTGSDLSVFDPGAAKKKLTQADSVIAYLKTVGQWPELEAAVDFKIDKQAEVVAWWEVNVGVRQSPGRGGNKSSAVRGTIPMSAAESLLDITNQQVSTWKKRLKDRSKYKKQLMTPPTKRANAVPNPDGHHNGIGSGENEWYTPPEYAGMARAVMGHIDLDPASCAEANETIKAGAFYTKDDDGLSKEWAGNVWLNPPYSRDLMPAFVEKLASSYETGSVKSAILVSHNNTDTAWFHRLAETAAAICFPKKRIRFYRGADVAAPTNGQAFFYLGKDVAAFVREFSAIGFVVLTMSNA